jgi:serine/threonine-protein kinase
MQFVARLHLAAWGCALASGLAFSLTSSVASAADAADAAASEALFNRGRQLMSEGRYAEACPKLAESQRLDPGAGTALNLAECYEKQGKTATAWVTWLEAATLAKQAGQADREDFARGRAKALEGRLPRLLIEVAPNAAVAGLRVTRSGTEVREASFGIALPVDPGEQVVEASAPGYQPWRGVTKVEPGAQATVRIPQLVPASATPAPAPSAASGAPAPIATPTPASASGAAAPAAPPPFVADTPPRTGSARRTVGIVLTSVGGGVLALGGVFALSAKSLSDESKDDCRPDNQNLCNEDGVQKRKDAVATGNMATVLAIGGTAILGTGAILWMTAPSKTQVGAMTNGSDARLVVRRSF